MPSFLGWNIIPLPAFPAAPKSIEWKFGDTVGYSRSPFSLQKQTFNWQAAILSASLSYQPMNNAQFAQWRAFMAYTGGTANIFSIGDPLNTLPQNLSASGGTVTGGGQTGYVLNTSSSNMTPGDWIQIGLRLYLVTWVVGSTLGIWPQIRESPSDGETIVITNTTGLFRLSKNDRGFAVKEGGIYSLTFECEEAI